MFYIKKNTPPRGLSGGLLARYLLQGLLAKPKAQKKLKRGNTMENYYIGKIKTTKRNWNENLKAAIFDDLYYRQKWDPDEIEEYEMDNVFNFRLSEIEDQWIEQRELNPAAKYFTGSVIYDGIEFKKTVRL